MDSGLQQQQLARCAPVLLQHGLPYTSGMSQYAAVITITTNGCSGVAAQDYKDFLNDSSLVPVLTEVFQIGPNPGVMAHAVRSS